MANPRSPTEEEALAAFLRNSKELIEMRKIALVCEPHISYGSTNNGPVTEQKDYTEKEMIKKIAQARSFSELLHITQLPTEPNVGVRAVMFTFSFFNNHASFAHYGIKFRDQIIDIMAQNGYSDNFSPKPGQ